MTSPALSPQPVSEVEPILQMRSIWKAFGGVRALQGVSLACWASEVHALLGANGAGKSTLMNVLVGAVKPDQGEILLDGQLMHINSPSDAIRSGIAIIRQEFDLIPEMTVAENIFLGREPLLRFGIVDKKKMESDARLFLNLLDADIPVDGIVSYLSVAQQQIVMIAKALSRQARIIIMDEPSTSLAQKELERLYELTRSLSRQGKTVIYISHRLEEIFNVCTMATVLRDGCMVGSVNLSDVSQKDLIRMMIGKTEMDNGNGRNPEVQTSQKILLETVGLNQPGKLKDVNLKIHQGEVVGLAGLMGSGKTSIAHVLFGAERISSGEIHVYGQRVNLRSPADAIRLGIYLLPEDRRAQGLFMRMSILDNIGISNLNQTTRVGFVSRRKEEQIARNSVRDFSIITSGIDKIVRFLSGGNQQKVVLAKALTNQPKIIILDEPTRGIDVGAKEEIYTLVQNLAHEGAGVVLASSELPELLRLCDRIYVLSAGRVMGELTRADATQEKILTLASGISLHTQEEDYKS